MIVSSVERPICRGIKSDALLALSAWLFSVVAATSCSRGSSDKSPASRLETDVLTVINTEHVELRSEPLPTGGLAVRLGPGSPRLGEGRPYRAWKRCGRPFDLVTVRCLSRDLQADVLQLEKMNGRYRLLEQAALTESGDTTLVAAEAPESGESLIVLASTSPRGGTADLEIEAVPLPDYHSSGRPGPFALLAGAGTYPGTGSDLPGTAADLQLMRSFLMESGFPPENILILEDHEITRTRVVAAFRGHLGQAGPDETAVFYYSGHGIQLNSNIGLKGADDPESDGRDEALLMANGSVILDEELGYLAGELNSGRTLIILDCCYSGTGTKGDFFQKAVSYSRAKTYIKLPDHFLFEGGRSRPGHVLLAASRESEPAMVIAEPGTEAGTPGGLSGSGAQGKRYVSLFTLCFTEVASRTGGNLPVNALMDSIRTGMRDMEVKLELADQVPIWEGAAPGVTLRDLLSVKPATGISRP